MRKWLMAFWNDVRGREDENRAFMTDEERHNYTLGIGVACVAAALVSLVYVHLLVAIVFGAVAVRKIGIYMKKTGML